MTLDCHDVTIQFFPVNDNTDMFKFLVTMLIPALLLFLGRKHLDTVHPVLNAI